MNNNKLKAIFEKSPIGIIFYNKKGELTDINQSALQIARIPESEDIKKINLFDNPYIKTHKNKLLKNGFIKFESPIDLDNIKKQDIYTQKDSGIIYINYTVSVTDFGFLEQIQDITELKETELNFKTILDVFPEGNFLTDTEGNIIVSNKVLATRISKNYDDIVGLNIFDLIPPGIAKTRKKIVNEVIKGKKPQYYVDERDGIYIKSYVHPILNENGEVSKVFVTAEDITKRKKTEDALKKSEKNYRTIFESMTEAFMIGEIILDNKGNPYDWKYMSVNKVAAANYGIKPEQVIGKSFRELFPDINPPYIDEIGEVVLKDKIMKNKEMQSPITGNWLEIDIYPQRKNIFAIFTRDISERKKAEKALKDSEERYKTLVETLPDAIIVHSKGIIRFVNPAAIKLLKAKDEKEIIGKPILSIATKEMHDTIIKRIQQASTEQTPPIETKVVRLDGSIFYGEVTGKNIAYQNGSATQIIIRDISERKKAEEELKKSEEKSRLLIKYAPSMIYEIDFRIPKFISVNDAMCALLGYTREELLSIDPIDLLEDESKIVFQDRINNFLKGEKIDDTIEYTGRTKDGHLMYGILNMTFTKKNGVPIGAVVVAHDITERKKMEQKLRYSHDNLEEKVKERTIELEEAYKFLINSVEELERSNEELQQFAYITSHDLQEPLHTIASYAQLLERRYKGQLDSDADDFLEFMVSGAIRMKEQIQGLLEYSRVGTKGKEFKEFNSKEALNIALSNLKSSIEECNAEITFDELPIIFADKEQISRVFQNLISNALKFSREDIQPKIHITAQKNEDEFVFSIQDNGIGIEKQYVDRIFDVFKRLHPIGDYEGTGIGLSIVERIIHRHGGRVGVESEFGKGSTFYFSIPIKINNEIS